mgnify:CR=1 FL=1
MTDRKRGKAAKEFLEDDCNTCDLLGAQVNTALSHGDAKSTKAQQPQIKPIPPKPTQNEAPFWEMPDNPPDIVEMGNAGWTTIHSFAAYYPDQPNETQKHHAQQFLTSFMELFPCTWCGDDMKEYMIDKPPRLNTRHDFSQWTCEAHNHVNTHLGKPKFDCSLFDKRWRRSTRKG